MPEIIIDGRKIEAKQGETIIQAAYRNGLQIPHFCWHPELSVSGNCRMCLVETGFLKKLPDGTFEHDTDGNPVVNYFPKLQIACATVASDGMYVRTVSQTVVDAQESVMEFILINHPLDCPICDEAGECKLQDYAFNYSKGESRFVEEKNHKDKRVEWGPNVMYDAERCISCSRCIRYAKEHAGQDILSFVNRGDKVTIKVANEKVFDNPYSMNVIEICPVGALTSKDFRFKSRVWDMSFNKSICTGCARGCNIEIGVRNNEILRLEPATNLYVNRYWMCDYGRNTQYQFVNGNRITEPLAKTVGELKETSFDNAYAKIADALKKYNPGNIMFIGSARATTEDNFILAKLAKQVVKTENIDCFKYENPDFGDDYLRVSDKTPNYAGAAEAGVKPGINGVNVSGLVAKINSGQIKMLYVLDDDLSQNDELLSVLNKLDYLVVHSSNYNKITELADIVLPSATYAESEGTFVNFKGRVQHFTPAIVTSENLRFMGMKMSRLDKFGSFNDRWANHETRNCRQSWRMLQSIVNLLGAGWKYLKSSDVFNEIAASNPKFKGMDYAKLDEYQGLTLGNADKPDPKLVNYVSHYLKPE